MTAIVQCGSRVDVRKAAAAHPVTTSAVNGPRRHEEGSVARGLGAPRASSTGKKDLMEKAVEVSRKSLQTAFPNVFVPHLGRDISYEEWYWKELKEGGVLHRYLDMEKRTSSKRMRAVRRKIDGFEQNNKSDHRLLAAVPAREYFRWKAVDPHFFEDNKNLKSLRRDNPDAAVFV